MTIKMWKLWREEREQAARRGGRENGDSPLSHPSGMRIIAVANHKGGVGKTTSCLNLAFALAAQGKKVLMMDLDPQAALTYSCGLEPEKLKHTVVHCLIEGLPLLDVLREVQLGIWLIPANPQLAVAELDLERKSRRTLRNRLEDLAFDFFCHFCLIDCPPSLNLLTINALTASDEVLIPFEPEFLSLRGVSMLFETVERARTLNQKLKVLGVLPTQYDSRLLHHGAVIETMREQVKGKTKLFAPIPRSIRFAESQLAKKTMLQFAPESKGARAYHELAEQLI
ncbi:MAG TPA: AAA family ATPase [Thermodesulfobacteriota bacterium]|nr:AAA family ATPase [Thermodesulfobacteriota bacterium]